MNSIEKRWLAFIRIAMGWLFFYAGITKVMDPSWTSAGYAKSAKTLTGMYEFFASSGQIGWVDFINQWGLTLIGISLILGIGVRLSSTLGAVLMFFYYIPILQFPYVGEHSYLVDEHVVYALILIYFALTRAGRFFGLEDWFARTFLRRLSGFQRIWG